MTYKIERLGHLGDGIAAGPVYAPRVLPGEVIDGELVGDRITSPKIITPSPDRVSAPCRHYKSCGGCSVQHASDAFVEDWKVGIVRTALEAQGLDVQVEEVSTSPPGSRRRAVFSGRRLKKGALVGFHGRGSGTLTAVPDCTVLDPRILEKTPALETLVTLTASRKSEVSVAVTLTNGGCDVTVLGGSEPDGPLRIELSEIAARHDLARLSWNDEVIVMRQTPSIRFGKANVTPPPNAFLQATPEGEAALLRSVKEAVGEADRVVDLFGGCGTFALPMAETASVHAVEGQTDMLRALDDGWRKADGLKTVTTEVRDLFRRPMEPDELNRFDAAVIDPPRAGAEAQMRCIAASGLTTVASVSCNPVTFARDAKILSDAGFFIKWLRLVDQFRWSAHIELAALFERPHIRQS